MSMNIIQGIELVIIAVTFNVILFIRGLYGCEKTGTDHLLCRGSRLRPIQEKACKMPRAEKIPHLEFQDKLLHLAMCKLLPQQQRRDLASTHRDQAA